MFQTLNTISTLGVVCQQCIHDAVACYNFITTTRETCELLNSTISSLKTCLDNTKEPLNTDKSLFLTFDSKDCQSQHYYHHKSASNASIASKQLFRILHPKPKRKKMKKQQENKLREDLDEENESGLETDLDCPRKRQPYFSLPMRTSEMLYDKSDRTKLKCKECLKVYPSLTSLRNHYIRVHAPKKHSCSICNKKFASISLLENHKKLSHCTVVCSTCGRTFHNLHTLKMHEIGHHFQIVCEDCGRVYKSQTTYKKHIDLNICGQITRASPANAQFTCDYCNKKYTQKVSLRVHIQYEHCNYKGHVCKWCKKSFYAQSRLKAHIVKHTQEKNFPCITCGGRFISKESLLYHTRIHTGERPYKCDFCDNRFLSASRKSQHMKQRHTGAVCTV